MAAFADKTILLTGASGGIGLEMARVLGREGARLIFVARSADRLERLAAELRALPESPRADIVPADLTTPGASDEVFRRAASFGDIDILINNAGVGEYGAFVEQEPSALEQMLQLNINALTRLTRLVLPGMLARRTGQIVNIASMAGFQPFPYMSAYAATKAFVINLSFGLYEELRDTGVSITCICPGTTRTGFFDRGNFVHRRSEILKMGADPADVAAECVRAIARQKRFFVPGRGNRFAAAIQRILPSRFLARLMGKFMKPHPPKKDAPKPA